MASASADTGNRRRPRCEKRRIEEFEIRKDKTENLFGRRRCRLRWGGAATLPLSRSNRLGRRQPVCAWVWGLWASLQAARSLGIGSNPGDRLASTTQACVLGGGAVNVFALLFSHREGSVGPVGLGPRWCLLRIARAGVARRSPRSYGTRGARCRRRSSAARGCRHRTCVAGIGQRGSST